MSRCEQCGGETDHFSACIGAERPGDWDGKNLWRLAAERGHDVNKGHDLQREEWEGDAEFHIRTYATIWSESLRVGLMDATQFAKSMIGLLEEVCPGVEGL